MHDRMPGISLPIAVNLSGIAVYAVVPYRFDDGLGMDLPIPQTDAPKGLNIPAQGQRSATLG